MRMILSSMIAFCMMTVYGKSIPLPAVGGGATTLTSRSNVLARTGGHLSEPVSGPVIRLINLQTNVTETVLSETAKNIQSLVRLPLAVSKLSDNDPMNATIQALAINNTAACIGIVDSPYLPSLLIAPEDRWALVNIAVLRKGLAKNQPVEDRVNKEIWRAFGYLMGAAHSNLENCLLKSVLKPEDLDALKSKTLSPEPFVQIMQHAKLLGIKPIRRVTYRQAAEEGWAPMPTNSFQKAIWDEQKKK